MVAMTYPSAERKEMFTYLETKEKYHEYVGAIFVYDTENTKTLEFNFIFTQIKKINTRSFKTSLTLYSVYEEIFFKRQCKSHKLLI